MCPTCQLIESLFALPSEMCQSSVLKAVSPRYSITPRVTTASCDVGTYPRRGKLTRTAAVRRVMGLLPGQPYLVLVAQAAVKMLPVGIVVCPSPAQRCHFIFIQLSSKRSYPHLTVTNCSWLSAFDSDLSVHVYPCLSVS